MENMNNVNLTNEALLNDADQREWTLNCVRQGDSYTLRKSHIWTKLNPDGFKTVCGVYMTVNQIAEFFGCDKVAIQQYTRNEIHGNPNEYKKELISAGVITLSNEECKDLVKKFMLFLEQHETLDNDMTDSWKPNGFLLKILSMTNVNNVNGQSMVNSKEVRDSQLAALENKLEDLRESHIWESTGGTFETVFRDYMTTPQVAEFFGVGITIIENYYKREEHKQELIDSGLIKKCHAELKEMKENFIRS